jgi:plastocyanin
MRAMRATTLLIASAAAMLAPGRARANGTIEGTIRLTGAAPVGTARPIVKDTGVCGKEAPDESVVVGKTGALANVVVFVNDARFPGKAAPTAGAAVDQKKCRYAPHVQAVTVGTPLAVMNNDAVLHNVHGNEAKPDAPALTVFNVAMPILGQKLPVTMSKPGLVRLQCDAGHTWMNAWIYVFDHPYFGVTDEGGKFVIADVPPGEHVVELWHEPVDGKGPGTRLTAKVKVVDGKRARLELTFRL